MAAAAAGMLLMAAQGAQAAEQARITLPEGPELPGRVIKAVSRFMVPIILRAAAAERAAQGKILRPLKFPAMAELDWLLLFPVLLFIIAAAAAEEVMIKPRPPEGWAAAAALR